MEEDRESYEIFSNILLFDTEYVQNWVIIQQTCVEAATILWLVGTLLDMRNFDAGARFKTLQVHEFQHFIPRFHHFVDTTERGDRGRKQGKIGRETEGDFTDNSDITCKIVCRFITLVTTIACCSYFSQIGVFEVGWESLVIRNIVFLYAILSFFFMFFFFFWFAFCFVWFCYVCVLKNYYLRLCVLGIFVVGERELQKWVAQNIKFWATMSGFRQLDKVLMVSC